MGSFADGFSQGRGIVNDALDRAMKAKEFALREQEAARAAEKFSWERDDRRNVDTAFAGVTGLRSNGVVTDNTAGMSNEAAQALNLSGGQGLVDTTARLGNYEAGMLGDSALPGAAPQYGMSAPGAPTLKTRGATGIEMNSAMFKLAGAKRDMGAMRELDKERVGLEFEEGFTSHIGAFNKMTPEAKAALMEKATEDHGFPLNMVPSASLDKNGKPTYTTWVEGKPRVKLGDAEVADIYAAQQMMGTHPDMARARLAQSTKNVRELFKQYVELTDKQMDTNNAAQGHMDTRDNNAARLAEEKRYHDMYIGALKDRTAATAKTRDGKDVALWEKAVKVAEDGNYGSDPEKAYEALKRGYVRNDFRTQVSQLELDLRKLNTPDDQIAAQVKGFYASAGFAHPSLVEKLRTGMNPKTGKPLSQSDIAEWDAQFPNTPVEDLIDISKLPKATAVPKAAGMPERLKSEVSAPSKTSVSPMGGAVGNAIRAVGGSRGNPPTYEYRGQTFKTREEAEAARSSYGLK